jgi:hypothetical protein
MGFDLTPVAPGRDSFRLSIDAMAAVREALALVGAVHEARIHLARHLHADMPPRGELAVADCKLAFSSGQLMSARECLVLAGGAAALVASTRAQLELTEAERGFLELLERFGAFCQACACDGGFRVR